MRSGRGLAVGAGLGLVALGAAWAGGLCARTAGVVWAEEPAVARGVVFEDRDGDGVRDPDEPGLAGVRVSNQLDVVETDAEGRYTLPVGSDTILFVVKPRGYLPPVDALRIPRFYYIHKPAGSPKTRFAGVKPTGPLPASVDFPLIPSAEPERFRAIFFGDPQPRNVDEVRWIGRDVIAELAGTDAAFGVTLGDIAFNDLATFEPLSRMIALIGIPWYQVIGNHDLNFDAPSDELSDETFEAHYGPAYYSFDWGPTHFIVLDDVRWHGATDQEKGRYTSALGEKQLAFVRNDLARVPSEKLVVLMMHIPITSIADREELYRLIESRPACISVSGHTHTQEHRFLGEKNGWRGAKPHHHIVNVTVCGSWWKGPLDELGIPEATMKDGAPNGYSVFTFDGSAYSIEYRAARRGAEAQLHIVAPDVVTLPEASPTLVMANVYAASERSTVEMRVAGGPWLPMRQISGKDPSYVEAYERSLKGPKDRRLPDPESCSHLYGLELPAELPAGTHAIDVRTVDMFGQRYRSLRPLEVRRTAPPRAETY